MRTLCATCTHDKYPSGCEYACMGVNVFDEVTECVTDCEDYEEGKRDWSWRDSKEN